MFHQCIHPKYRWDFSLQFVFCGHGHVKATPGRYNLSSSYKSGKRYSPVFDAHLREFLFDRFQGENIPSHKAPGHNPFR